MLKEITAADIAAFNPENLTLLKFTAPWCSACKAIQPALDKMAGEMDNTDFVELNVDNNQEFALELGIRSIPSFGFYKDNKLVHLEKGMTPIAIKKKITEING